MERRFPQLVLQAVVHEFPAEHPFGLYAFWIFNAGAFAGDERRGRKNHALMLAVDPVRGESSIIAGYGLEPLLPRPAVDHLLELAGPAWESGDWAEGIHRVFDGLEPLLESVASLEMPEADDAEF